VDRSGCNCSSFIDRDGLCANFLIYSCLST
jgi:hypothetical protein